VSSLSYLYLYNLYNEYRLWVGSLYLGKTFLVPLVAVIMLLSVVGLFFQANRCVKRENIRILRALPIPSEVTLPGYSPEIENFMLENFKNFILI